jgi:hypothetical protein
VCGSCYRVTRWKKRYFVFVMGLYPPWKEPTDYGGEADAGYKLVFWPSHGHTLDRIDSARLADQLIAVIALAGAAYLILHRPRK